MNDHSENLLDVLEKEFEAYEDLEGILLKEREVLRRPKFANFEEQIGLKAQVVHRISALEQERTQLMAVLSSEQGQDTENLHLIDLVRNTPPPLAKRFMDVRGRLLETTDRVKQVNEINRKIIGELLSVMNGVMDSVQSAFAEPAMYGTEGKLGKKRVQGGDFVFQSV